MVAFVFAGRMRRAGRLVLAAAAVVLVVSVGNPADDAVMHPIGENAGSPEEA